MNKYFQYLNAVFLLFASQSLVAKTITCGVKPVPVEIRYGRPTVFRFDNKVSSVQNAERFEVGPLNDQTPNYAEISVKPRTTSAQDTVNFHLADGSIVMLKLIPVTGPRAEGLETFHVIKKKEDRGLLSVTSSKPDSALNELAETTDDGDGKVELMKALILGSKLRGYQIKTLEKPLTTGLAGVEATLVRVYSGKELNGYVFRITNVAAKSKYEIDVRRLKLGEPNLALMSQVDQKVIEPSGGKNVAYLTIVALPSSLSRDVVLPVSWVKKEEK